MANFPPRVELSSLDGSNGFRIENVYDNGMTASDGGDVNGDGFDDLIFGLPGVRDWTGVSYVIFGTVAGFAPVFALSNLDGSNGFRIEGFRRGDQSGISVGAAGDVNRDGVDDLVIGANTASPGRYRAGETSVVFGSETGFAPVLKLASLDGHNGFRIPGINRYDFSGESVSAAGDVNGDGIADLLIAAPVADPGGRNDAGESYVVFGTAAGFAPVLELSSLGGSNGFRIEGIHASDISGTSVSGAGDVNGDGVDDLIVGAWRADPGGRAYAGESYIVFGSKTGFAPTLELSSLNGTNGFRIEGIHAGDGSAIASNGGDVNGDGLNDLVIGTLNADPNGRIDAGESYVVFGSTAEFAPVLELSSLDGKNGFRIEGIHEGDFSRHITSAGDVNADGVDDLLIGATGADPGGRDRAGESYVIFGTAAGFAPTFELSSLDGSNGFRIEGIDRLDFSGGQSAAGDVNGDGADDLLIGGDHENYVVFGKSSAVIDGTASGEHLRGDVAANRIEGAGGDDRLEGAANDDTLHGGAGRDQLFGGDGKDVLDGGAGRDIVFGGHDADVFVLGNTDSFDLIRDFAVAEDDKVRITIPEVTNASAEVDSSLVRGIDSNGSMLIQVDQDFDASNGFQAATIASIAGAGGLGLGEVLENGLF